MRYVGLDLAWGQRARTGAAALDEDGRLVASATLGTDDEVVAWVAQHAPGDVVAAVDAPLVLADETGQRPCERDLNAVYAPYRAGAHPSNLSRPHFRPRPRGAVLADRLAWRVDPELRPAPGLSTAVEVYPHPAMVSLFGLGSVIPYKQKPGRDLPSLRLAWGELLGHLERTCGGLLRLQESPRWEEVRAVVAAATRKADLRRVEDEVDAVLCAYLAWLWAHRREEMRVFGDAREGFVVTPRALPVPPARRRAAPPATVRATARATARRA